MKVSVASASTAAAVIALVLAGAAPAAAKATTVPRQKAGAKADCNPKGWTHCGPRAAPKSGNNKPADATPAAEGK